MDQFEYVMVLVSIIVGLGIAHVLLGIGGIVDRLSGKHDRLELSWAHAAWLGHCFLWLVMFWWWEYELSTTVADWTMGRYLFLISYAITLFLLQVVLIPRTWDGVISLKEYFLERRVWFYGLYGIATILDCWIRSSRWLRTSSRPAVEEIIRNNRIDLPRHEALFVNR